MPEPTGVLLCALRSVADISYREPDIASSRRNVPATARHRGLLICSQHFSVQARSPRLKLRNEKTLSPSFSLPFLFLDRCFCGICRRNRPYRRLPANYSGRRPALPRSFLASAPPASGRNMEFLASDALRGRGSATADELVAATYVAAQLRAYGISPAGDNGGYLQRAGLLQPKFTAPPQLTFAQVRHRRRKNYLDLRQGVRGPLSRASPLLRPVARDQR